MQQRIFRPRPIRTDIFKARMDFDMRRALAQLQLVGFLLLSAVSAFAQGGVTLRRPTPPTVKRNFVAASVHALPGLHCQLYPAGATPSSGVTVFTDDDGFARFRAIYRSPDAKPTKRPVARPPDYFYLEAETPQVRLLPDGK